ncbi:MAG: hypothetical protein IPM78_00385 [Moraxellaceae bacterium]|jgi:hypothetical protein|nr:hypothetical protein [Moraxellaceae bacterium]
MNDTPPKSAKIKKEAQLVIRLDKDLRDQFVDACQQLDTSASRELRRFMKKFLVRYQNGELDD